MQHCHIIIVSLFATHHAEGGWGGGGGQTFVWVTHAHCLEVGLARLPKSQAGLSKMPGNAPCLLSSPTLSNTMMVAFQHFVRESLLHTSSLQPFSIALAYVAAASLKWNAHRL